jgi:hypothetical protein
LGVAFEIEATVALLGSRDFDELARSAARAIAERRANLDETAGNTGCRRDEFAP